MLLRWWKTTVNFSPSANQIKFKPVLKKATGQLYRMPLPCLLFNLPVRPASFWQYLPHFDSTCQSIQSFIAPTTPVTVLQYLSVQPFFNSSCQSSHPLIPLNPVTLWYLSIQSLFDNNCQSSHYLTTHVNVVTFHNTCQSSHSLTTPVKIHSFFGTCHSSHSLTAPISASALWQQQSVLPFFNIASIRRSLKTSPTDDIDIPFWVLGAMRPWPVPFDPLEKTLTTWSMPTRVFV